MDAFTQGSCLCGAVTYLVSTPLKAITHCHCKKCQKSHGAAFATYASAPLSAITVQATPAALKSYESSPGVVLERRQGPLSRVDLDCARHARHDC